LTQLLALKVEELRDLLPRMVDELVI
jgi:hypothetical protein